MLLTVIVLVFSLYFLVENNNLDQGTCSTSNPPFIRAPCIYARFPDLLTMLTGRQ
ncbi:MAG: hypothetical protein ABIT96_08350 [Ferruginibacter sp.]